MHAKFALQGLQESLSQPVKHHILAWRCINLCGLATAKLVSDTGCSCHNNIPQGLPAVALMSDHLHDEGQALSSVQPVAPPPHYPLSQHRHRNNSHAVAQ